jgi:hypothetical protein
MAESKIEGSHNVAGDNAAQRYTWKLGEKSRLELITIGPKSSQIRFIERAAMVVESKRHQIVLPAPPRLSLLANKQFDYIKCTPLTWPVPSVSGTTAIYKASRWFIQQMIDHIGLGLIQILLLITIVPSYTEGEHPKSNRHDVNTSSS